MISKKLKYVLVFMIGALFLAPTLIQAKGDKKDSRTRLNKTTAQRASTFLDINNISTWFYNNGISDITPQGNSGLVYPKGSGKTAVFTSGLLWGAKVDGDPDPRVGGTAYRTGLLPGNVDANGKAADGTLDRFRIYRVRRDVFPGGPLVNLANDAVNEGSTEAELRANYEQDWTEWPADMGAPYDDKNSNGQYEPSIDVPGVPGADQTIWFVMNDLDPGQTTFLYGANPLGLEVQETVWAYNKAGALGNMYFRKYTFKNITNRGNLTPTTFKDMYVSMWSDVDLGGAGDDFVGVDTVLSLQYSYNATNSDATYSPLPPPAVGFDFFQGPRVKGIAGQDRNKNGIDDTQDTLFTAPGVFVIGEIYLPMTAAYYFANGDPNIGDPGQGSIQGSREFYNFFQGKFGVSGVPFTDLATGQPTTFALNGDPVAGTGWLDGVQLPPGDRRQGSASGPFDMAPGDVQEVVVAEIVAGATPGSDNLKAITQLKILDDIAQNAYNDFFRLPDAPPAPVVSAAPLDQKIVLDWGSSLSDVIKTETNVNKNFKFQGYNLYQFPTASSQKENGVRIATWDIVDGIKTIFDKVPDPTSGQIVNIPVQFGSDKGISRSITLNKDFIKQTPLINGIKYYYAVTSYSYSPDPNDVPNNLENPISSSIFTVIPHSPDPGVTYSYSPGDTLTSIHKTGNSDGSAFALVIDPTKVTGHEYEVTFNTDGSWNLVDKTTGTTKLSNQTNQSGNADYAFVDGLQVKVLGPSLNFKKFSTVANANGPLDPPDGFGADYNGFPSIRPTGSQQVGAGKWMFASTRSSNNAYADVFADVTQYSGGLGEPNQGIAALIPDDFEIRFTATGSKGDIGFGGTFDGTIIDLPFELWDIADPSDPSDDFQIYAQILDLNDNGVFDIGSTDHAMSGGTNDPFTDGIYMIIPRDRTPGSAGYNALLTFATNNPPFSAYFAWAFLYGPPQFPNDPFSSYPGIIRTVFVNWNGGAVPGPYNQDMPEQGTIFRIATTKPNNVNDTFTLTPNANTSSNAKAVTDVEKINVFPNPYYAVNTEELNKYQKFVTFNHLPANAKIRIFNLAGIMVRTIDKVGGSQFQRWDLQNESGLPVASGIYIAYIDMPDLGTTKILKLAVIQEEQILDRF